MNDTPKSAGGSTTIAWPDDVPLWVFAYGSLMWDPGFAYLEAAPARLHGYHRSFCVRSEAYRGTRERPGLVFGLDIGGSCVGRAYRVADAEKRAVLDYLEVRELRRYTYDPARLTVRTEDRAVAALCFIVNRANDQYMGKLSLAAMATYVCQGVGERGACFDYLENTVAHLQALGIRDRPMERLLALAKARRGQVG